MKLLVVLWILAAHPTIMMSHAWQMRLETRTKPAPAPTTPTNTHPRRPMNPVRDSAGAESMFSAAKSMSKPTTTRSTNYLRIIQGAWNNTSKSKIRVVHALQQRKQQQRRRKRQRRRNNNEPDLSGNSSTRPIPLEIDLWGVEQTRRDLSLPSWACSQDKEEERRLAAMKIILSQDLKALESKTITNLQGSTVKVVDAFPDVYSDFRMLRFLRKDKVQDPVTAAVRFREFIEWRQLNRVDELVRLQVEANSFEPPAELAMVGDYLPSQFSAAPATKDGVVPVLLHVGEWDTDTIAKLIRNNTLPLSSFLKYWTYMFESLHYHLYQESMRTQQMVFIDEICDLSSMSLAQFTPSFISTVLKPWMDLTQRNYPETAKRLVFWNPPKIISVVWRIVTPLASPGTVAKVKLLQPKECLWDGSSARDYYRENYSVQKEKTISPSVHEQLNAWTNPTTG